MGECVLAEEKTRLECGNFGDSARRGRCSGGGTGEPLDREEADSRFGDIEVERPSSGIFRILMLGDVEGNLSVEPDRRPSPPTILFGLRSAAKSGSKVLRLKLTSPDLEPIPRCFGSLSISPSCSVSGSILGSEASSTTTLPSHVPLWLPPADIAFLTSVAISARWIVESSRVVEAAGESGVWCSGRLLGP